MTEDVIDPGKRYSCETQTGPARVFLKRGTPWPLQVAMRVLYRTSESSSAHWTGALITQVGEDGFFCMRSDQP